MQVRYSSTGGIYVTASKDGAIRLWDGVTSQCVRSILSAHGTAEATSAIFTKDQKYGFVMSLFIGIIIITDPKKYILGNLTERAPVICFTLGILFVKSDI